MITWQTSSGSVLIALAVVIAGIALGWIAYVRSGRSVAIGRLEVLRIVILALVAVLWCGPQWIHTSTSKTLPTVAVLWDDSASMETIDVVPAGSTKAIARAESIRSWQQREAWKKMAGRMRVTINGIGGATQDEDSGASTSPISGTDSDETSGANTGTDLGTALASAASDISGLAAVVLISDGDWNVGEPPVDAATRLRLANVPIFAVPVGSPTRLPDIELVSVDVPTFAPLGQAVRIPFSIDSSLPRPHVTTVTMTTSDGQTIRQPITIAPGGRTSDAITWTAGAVGELEVTVSVDSHPSETIAENNSVTSPIAVRREALRVLIVESVPRWEYRYLRNALSRDPGVEVSCLLFHPSLAKVGGGSSDYLAAFPERMEDLTQYDVVFLGDVGLSDNQLTAEQCELIRGLVEFQASGLVFMPGWQGRQFELADTPLGELIPVVMDASLDRGVGTEAAGRFELTAAGRRSLLTKLADTPDENVAVWENLPGFQWHAGVVRAKAGSEVLAVHGDVSNQYGRLPLLVTRTIGTGKILFMGTDGAWRWRKGVEDKYHYRFWGQVVRWMAYQRNMAKGESMRLYYTPDQPKLGQTMSLFAHVMDNRGEPLANGNVTATITAPSGKVASIGLSAGDPAEGEQAWGVFEGRLTPSESGSHAMTIMAKETSTSLDAKFFVQGQTIEQIGRPARPDVMNELARVSRGETIDVNELDALIDRLDQLPRREPVLRRTPIWSHPMTAALLIGLLATFWVLRKSAGLV